MWLPSFLCTVFHQLNWYLALIDEPREEEARGIVTHFSTSWPHEVHIKTVIYTCVN